MKLSKNISALAIVGCILTFALANTIKAASNVNLKTTSDYAVLAGAGITNTGPTIITGNIGTFPITTEVGFGSITLNGTNNSGNAVTQIAKTDLVSAYNDAAGQTPITTVPTELGGTVKKAGTYDSADGTFQITGTLTLDGEGNSDAVFVFKTGSTLVTASSSKIVLINGAQSCHIFWQVTSSATLGTNSSFKGNILALTSATLTTGASVEGRILARNGAVTLDSNTITRGTCSSSSTTSSSDIKVKKEASKKKLQSGPDKVTFTYKVTNEGSVPLTDISIKDDKCDKIESVSGDDNNDEKLDVNEEWKYRCTKTVKKTETNIVTVKGTANGVEVKDKAEETVTVTLPGLPNAGINTDKRSTLLEIINEKYLNIKYFLSK